jgi:hypothetical protein
VCVCLYSQTHTNKTYCLVTEPERPTLLTQNTDIEFNLELIKFNTHYQICSPRLIFTYSLLISDISIFYWTKAVVTTFHLQQSKTYTSRRLSTDYTALYPRRYNSSYCGPSNTKYRSRSLHRHKLFFLAFRYTYAISKNSSSESYVKHFLWDCPFKKRTYLNVM